jgi:drug/metabolite transporter (DMT)-like permease
MQALWMLVAGLMFAVMGVFVKLGASYFSTAELVFYRSAFGLLFIAIIMRAKSITLVSSHYKNHIWRDIAGFASLMMSFYSISRLPLATAVTLNYTSPLFLALIVTVMFKERPHWPLISAIVLGFLGAVLLLKPVFQSDQIVGGLLGLSSGFFAGIAYFNVKRLALSGEPESRIVFYFCAVCTVGAGIWMLVHTFHPITLENVGILLGIGASATIAQLALTRAYGRGATLVAGALAYSTVVFSSILGIFIWNEVLPLSSWLAIGLIVLSGVLSVKAVPRTPAPELD